MRQRLIGRFVTDAADPEAKFVWLEERAPRAVTLAGAGEKHIGTIETEAVRVRHPESHKQIVGIGAADKLGQISLYGDDDTKPLVTLGAGEQGAVLQSLRGGRTLGWPGDTNPAPATPEKPTPEKPAKPAKPMPPEPEEEKGTSEK